MSEAGRLPESRGAAGRNRDNEGLSLAVEGTRDRVLLQSLRGGDGRLVLFLGNAQRRTGHVDSDAIVPEAVEEGIDQ
jgi:hypothetical protein